MILGIVALVIGAILVFIAVGHHDEERRARGRGRTNSILTDFGGGSFKDGVSASVSEWTHGCLSKAFFWGGLLCLVFALKSCSGE